MPQRVPYTMGLSLGQSGTLVRNFRELEARPFMSISEALSSAATGFHNWSGTTVHVSTTVSVPGNSQVFVTGAVDLRLELGGTVILRLETVYPDGTTKTESNVAVFSCSSNASIEGAVTETWRPTPQVGKHIFRLSMESTGPALGFAATTQRLRLVSWVI